MGAAPRIGILVVAYNAGTRLRAVLDRIPPDFRPRISAILVSDDHSSDDTHVVGLEIQQAHPELPITVVRQPRNLGYGGNQKFGYRWAIEQGLDIVVLLHGDGQYAPELLPDMVAPIERHEAEVVLGSRMMQPGDALRGGMPRYKYLGNRILTTVQNAVAGLDLTEWHSGYRAFSVAALGRIPFTQGSDGFDFDTEVLIQLHGGGARIAEIPIPTYYGDEICYVNGVAYARDVVTDVVRYRLQRMGFGSDTLVPREEAYQLKPDEGSSHRRLVAWAAERRPTSVLDLGCADGSVSAPLRTAGHRVVGVDVVAAEGVKERLDRFVLADLDAGVPEAVRDEGPYGVILAADVLEHLRTPEELLRDLHGLLAPGGRLLVSIPNFGHWYPRARVASGRFDYDRRGILDRSHLRFFTARSIERLLHRSGWHVVRRHATGLPFDVVDRGGTGGLAGRVRALTGRVDRWTVERRPTLFGYELLYELEPA